MIQVYKKNELFVIEDTITETIYPNLTREETVELLKKFDRDEPEDRCDFAIKEDNISFEYASIDDKDKIIADLETKLAEKEKEIEYQESMKILAIENKNQKAIEQLEKVKSAFGLINSKLDKVETIKEYIHYIDHQINELKGKV